jgi:lysophospholipase L1-like esterase
VGDVGDRDWLLVGVGLLVALLVVPTYCSDEPSPPGTVLLVGDSLFFQSGPTLHDAVAADGWNVEIWAIPGATLRAGGATPMDWSPATLERLVDRHDPAVVVIELGTNGCGPGCTSIPDSIDALLEHTETVPVVLWLDAREDAPSPPERVEINRALDDATDRWDNLTVLSFDEWIRGQPGLVAPDGIHLTEAGQMVMADEVRGAIGDHTDVGIPPPAGQGDD